MPGKVSSQDWRGPDEASRAGRTPFQNKGLTPLVKSDISYGRYTAVAVDPGKFRLSPMHAGEVVGRRGAGRLRRLGRN